MTFSLKPIQIESKNKQKHLYFYAKHTMFTKHCLDKHFQYAY